MDNKKKQNSTLAAICLVAAFFILGVFLVARKSNSLPAPANEKKWGLVPDSDLPNDITTDEAFAAAQNARYQDIENKIESEQPHTNSQDSNMPADACFKELDSLHVDVRAEWRPQLELLAGFWFFDNRQEKLIPAEQQESTLAGKFLLGLAKGGFLTKKSAAENSDEAIQLLREVHDADPTNSAPYLYIAVIEKKRGRNESSDRYFAAAKNSTHFDSYVTGLARGTYRLVKTPHELMGAIEVVATMPLPDYSTLRNLIVEHKEPFFARQLMQDANGPVTRIKGADWIPMESMIGYSALEKMGASVAGLTPPRQMLRAQKDPLWQLTEHILVYADKTPCKLEEFRPMIQELERRYGK